MRWLSGILLVLLVALQYRLWVGDGSLAEVQALREEISVQEKELERLRDRNQTLEAEVLDLRQGLEALEERARNELGMIKQGEMFLQVIEQSGEDSLATPVPSADGDLPSERSEGRGGLRRGDVTAAAGRKP